MIQVTDVRVRAEDAGSACPGARGWGQSFPGSRDESRKQADQGEVTKRVRLMVQSAWASGVIPASLLTLLSVSLGCKVATAQPVS